MKPLVSINIVAFNAHSYLKKALTSALAQSYRHIEVYVLDNNSSDDTLALAKSFTDKRLHIVTSKMNTGFAKGHNILIDESKGEYVLLLNQDAWLKDDYVKKALEIFEKDDKIAAIQPKLFRYDFAHHSVVERNGGYVLDTTGLLMLKNRRIIARGQGMPDEGQFDKQEEVFGADGAVPMYRRQALDDVKLALNSKERDSSFEYFDEDFFMYKEDVDLSWRLRLAGWKIIYDPGVIAYHQRGSGESASTSYRDIVRERKNISALAKSLSWRNQRLMQVKNELPALYLRHLPFIAAKEIASFAYILLFERYALRSMKDFFALLPNALRKRRSIKARRIASASDMKPWFQ